MDINLCSPEKLLLDQMDINLCPPNQLSLNQIDINLCLPEKLLLDKREIKNKAFLCILTQSNRHKFMSS